MSGRKHVRPDVPPAPAAARARIEPWDLLAVAALTLWFAFIAWVVLLHHPVPLYQVETDLLGEYIPAARELLRGILNPAHYTSKGVGYPLLLAAAVALCGGDAWLAARALNLVAALLAAVLVHRIARQWVGRRIAFAVLLALFVNHAFVQAAVEAGSDLPALALALAAMLCLARTDTGRITPGAERTARDTRLVLAGLLAGATILTRSNYAVLPVAAGVWLLAQRAPARALAAYLLGCAAPLVVWALAMARGADSQPHVSQNALNVAYEFYGNSGRDAFWTNAAPRFHGLLDVVRFAPGRFATHALHNLGTRWIDDTTRLLTLYMGVPALLGLALGLWRGAWRRRTGALLALQFGFAYAALAMVFYLPRFSLFLVPGYLMVAAWLVLRAGQGQVAPGARTAVGIARGLLWLGLLAPVALQTATAQRDLLLAAPVEARFAGELVRMAEHGDAPVMASKPHAAFFAGQPYVPLPAITTWAELFDAAQATHARYLFYSRPETVRCPQFLGLLGQGATLPGLERVERDVANPLHYFGLYRFTGERPIAAALDSAAIELARQMVAENPSDLLAITTLADQLEHAGRPREALAVLEAPAREAPEFAPIARFQAQSYLDLGVVDSAGLALERLLATPDATGWDWGLLGRVRERQGRQAEARDAYAKAVSLDPSRDDLQRAFRRADSLQQGRGR